jgi:hypothetical protein
MVPCFPKVPGFPMALASYEPLFTWSHAYLWPVPLHGHFQWTHAFTLTFASPLSLASTWPRASPWRPHAFLQSHASTWPSPSLDPMFAKFQASAWPLDPWYPCSAD